MEVETPAGLFDAYEREGFFDEVFDAAGQVRPHYPHLLERLGELDAEELARRERIRDRIFRQLGMTRVLPVSFAQHRVRPVDHYGQLLLRALRQIAPPAAGEDPQVVLTPGIYNSAYFEHAFLRRRRPRRSRASATRS